MSKERKLGRGLETLFGNIAAQQPDYHSANTTADSDFESDRLSVFGGEPDQDALLETIAKGRPVLDVPIDKIDPNPYQPRLDFDSASLTELAESLKKHGMIQPVILRRCDDRFQLVAGERRLRAAQRAGWGTVPAHLLVVGDREMAELALTENIQRKDLNAIEKAIAFRKYLDTYGGNQGELARRLDLDHSTVSNLMRLLDLPSELQQAICRGELTQGHARALLPLEESEQFDAARRIVAEDWSVRQTEEFVRNLLDTENEDSVDTLPAPPKRTLSNLKDAHYADLEQQFRSLLGSKVRLTVNDRGAGKLVVPFRSNDEFERIYQLILSRLQ